MSKKQPITLSTNEEYLLDLFIGRFRYSNCPDTINPEWFERCFALDGFSTVSLAPNGDLVNVSSTYCGVSPYGSLPTTTITANPALGSWTRTIGKDCVIGYNHTLPHPTLPIIQKYAKQLDEIDVNIIVNLNNIKTSRIFSATDSSEVIKISDMIRRISNGEPAILITGDIFREITGDNRPVTYSDTVDYMVGEFIIDRQNIISRYLTEIGVDSNLITKRERMISSEIGQLAHESEHIRTDYIRNRTEYVNRINAMFNTNITVEWSCDYNVSSIFDRDNQAADTENIQRVTQDQ